MVPPQFPGEPGRDSDAGVPRPRTIDQAFWSGIASVVVGFAAMAVVLLTVGEAQMRAAVEQARTQGQQFTPEQIRSLYTTTVITLFIVMAIIAALWIMFLVYLRRGRNWARIVITVVGVLWFLLTIPSAFGRAAGGVVTSALAVVQLVVVAATIVLVYLTPSNEFFIASRRSLSR